MTVPEIAGKVELEHEMRHRARLEALVSKPSRWT